MTPEEKPLLADLREEFRVLAAQLREGLALRSELARLEIHEDLRRVRRLTITAGLAGVLILASIPLPAVAAAELLDGCGGIADWGWLLIFAGGLFLAALAVIAVAWRCFRRRVTLLRQTLEELREDLIWLREWCGKKEEATETPRNGGPGG